MFPPRSKKQNRIIFLLQFIAIVTLLPNNNYANDLNSLSKIDPHVVTREILIKQPNFDPVCGDTITTNTTLTADLAPSGGGANCPGVGLIIGANDITLDCAGHKILGSVSPADGIRALGVDGNQRITNITIRNCDISGFNGEGIKVSFAQNILLEGNDISGNTNGVTVTSSLDSDLNDNIVDGNTSSGIFISSSTSGNITGNQIRNHSQIGSTGLYLTSANDFTISANILDNNYRGIAAESASDGSMISNNTVNSSVGSAYGISMSNTGANTLTRNTLYKKGLFEAQATPSNIYCTDVGNRYLDGAGKDRPATECGPMPNVGEYHIRPDYTTSIDFDAGVSAPFNHNKPGDALANTNMLRPTKVIFDGTGFSYNETLYITADQTQLYCSSNTLDGVNKSKDGIYIKLADYIQIYDCRLNNFDRAIAVDRSIGGKISNADLIGNNYGLAAVGPASSYEITLSNIYNNSIYNIYNPQAPSIVAQSNWWGTADETSIDNSIWDLNDQQGYGEIVYVPYLSAAVSTELNILSFSALPDSKVGDPYFYRLTAVGGQQPHNWSLVSGNLPTGVSLSEEGLLAGPVLATGEFSFTLRLQDNLSNTVEKAFTMNVVTAFPQSEVDLRKVMTVPYPGKISDMFIEARNKLNRSVVASIEEKFLESWEVIDYEPKLEIDYSDPAVQEVLAAAGQQGFNETLDASKLTNAGQVPFVVPLSPFETKILHLRIRLNPSHPLGTAVHGPADECKNVEAIKCAIEEAGPVSEACIFESAQCNHGLALLDETILKAIIGACTYGGFTCLVFPPACELGLARCLNTMGTRLAFRAARKAICFANDVLCGRKVAQIELKCSLQAGCTSGRAEYIPSSSSPRNSLTLTKPAMLTAMNAPSSLYVEKMVTSRELTGETETLSYFVVLQNEGAVSVANYTFTEAIAGNLDVASLKVVLDGGSLASLVEGAPVTIRNSGGSSIIASLSGSVITWDMTNINLNPEDSLHVGYQIATLPSLSNGAQIISAPTNIRINNSVDVSSNSISSAVDTELPTCTVNPLPSSVSNPSFVITVNATDNSAIDKVAVFAAEAGKPYQSIAVLYDSLLTLNEYNQGHVQPFSYTYNRDSIRFNGTRGKSYNFMCVAIDKAGNQEVQTNQAEATVYVQRLPKCMKKGQKNCIPLYANAAEYIVAAEQ